MIAIANNFFVQHNSLEQQIEAYKTYCRIMKIDAKNNSSLKQFFQLIETLYN